ncbi:hypothetical protein [Amycolatopsis sp.]|uniref:hypothetical protein n=1 Tax=Amycolatopsis sp. TaxID=37632 RepID=UPI002C25F783|nr:hypothetical protein [Amycolatopsis sp.]HVV07794.1 hypothetical protein [Amycolatopsis sp.]
MPSVVSLAELALFRRATLACAAAEQAGIPGGFQTREVDGLLIVAVGHPDLGFLSTVTGIAAPEAAGLVRLPDRLLAVKELDAPSDPVARVHEAEDEDVDAFARILLAGYEATGTIARFIEAGHRSEGVHNSLWWTEKRPSGQPR